ncbi:urease accessory protein UreD [Streptomyces sp. NBC_01443]|uniref:urease accessory protein UreD n=1 Tax=Streptomyces sp. NBC_01443 TaxID=2903868 RepID=UPI002257803B|nr:urease accessory protein UreD [Streptomyces sp. NBC_01443]MCX4626354.1 urease accessory protein UreD [Streptomyces sp. NBC_01443]
MTLTTEHAQPTDRHTPVTGVRATARITAAARGGTTTLPVLDGDGPFELRRLRSRGTEARVCIVGAMSAPLGGDRLRIEAIAQQHSQLHITSTAATLALKGPTTAHATYDVHLTVEEHAELHWLPKPLICAAGSNLRQTWTINLAPTARLLLREEQVLGRTGELPGHVVTRLTVRHGEHVLLDQEAEYGPGAPGWDGPAVLGHHRATGQILSVDPAFENKPPKIQVLRDAPEDGQAILTPLAGPAALVTAVAPDGLRLRHLMNTVHSTHRRPATMDHTLAEGPPTEAPPGIPANL